MKKTHIKLFEEMEMDFFNLPIEKYILDQKNFPELDNIKDILQDLSDWCFLHSSSIKYRTEIFRYNNDSKVSITWDILNGNLNFINKQNYYKSYYIGIDNVQQDKYKRDLKEQINLVIKRLINYDKRFKIIFNPIFYTHYNNGLHLYIIDEGDPITMEEIISKYETFN